MPKDLSKTAQDHPKTRPGTIQERKKLRLIWELKSGLERNPLRTSVFESLGVDFGRFCLVWFWEVLKSIFRGFA